MKTAVITGITGQTGSYLSEILLDEGYKVYGLRRRSSTFNTERIDHVLEDPHVDSRLELIYGDLSDASSIISLVSDVKPDLFFNTAAQSHVRVSFEIPEYTFDINSTGTIRCLEAIRRFSPGTRFVQSSTSELYGSTPAPQNESTPFHPRSPYAASKIAAYWATINYREAYGIHASNAVSHNHESSRRGGTFVTKKITQAAARIKYGLQDKLYLGNLEARRDWSYAKDIAKAQYLMATTDLPADDYVVGSGESHSVQEFLEIVFEKVGLEIKDYVEFDPRYLRPSEVDHLEADPAKIKRVLGWKPEYSFIELVDEMIEYDLEMAKKEKLLLENK